MPPNDADQDRLNATTRDAKVVDLDAYRTQAGTRKTAQPYFSSGEQSGIFFVALAFALFFFFIAAR